MTIQNSTFGFLDYFVANVRERIPCQFFRSGTEMLARLDGGGRRPVLTAVCAPMRAEVLGSFTAVLERYKRESELVLAAENFWRECEDDGAGSLKFFQVVHHMRLYGGTVSEGIDAAINLSRKLRESEHSAARAIYEIFSADLLRLGIEAVPSASPVVAPRASTLLCMS